MAADSWNVSILNLFYSLIESRCVWYCFRVHYWKLKNVEMWFDLKSGQAMWIFSALFDGLCMVQFLLMLCCCHGDVYSCILFQYKCMYSAYHILFLIVMSSDKTFSSVSGGETIFVISYMISILLLLFRCQGDV